MNENLIRVLNEFGQELKQLLKENIEAEGGVATGDMLNSIDYEVDEETGEIVGTHVENRIINYTGNFIYFDSKILAERYGNRDYST